MFAWKENSRWNASNFYANEGILRYMYQLPQQGFKINFTGCTHIRDSDLKENKCWFKH